MNEIPIYWQGSDKKIFLGNSSVIPRIGDSVRTEPNCPCSTIENIFWDFIDGKPHVSLSAKFRRSGH